jgi:hypothetical protein
LKQVTKDGDGGSGIVEITSEAMGLEVEIIVDNLECSIDGKRVWSTPIDAIVLIAEYTTNGGYWGDDSFLLIKSFEHGELIDVRVTDSVIGGLGVLLRALGERLGATLDLKLPYAVKWNSRVMWPEPVKGEKLFRFDAIVPVGIWAKLKDRFLGGSRGLAIAKPVQDYLRRYEAQPKV